jgi:phosphate transport system substrate-binding protein
VAHRTQHAHTCRRVVVLLALSAACSPLAAPDESAAPALVSFKIAGSSALLPFAAEAANAYMNSHPGVAIQVDAGGSEVGLAQVTAGTIAIGMSDLFARGDRGASLEDHEIGVVGVAAMANRGSFNASIKSLSMEQLRRIFTGQARNWSELGGGNQPITIISRHTGTGTRTTFGAIVLGGEQFAFDSIEAEDSSQVQTALVHTAGAISYLALAYRRAELAVFELDGTFASSENIEAGTYPIWSYAHLYTRGPATGQVRAFIDYVLSVPVQRDVLPRLGLIAMAAMKVTREQR